MNWIQQLHFLHRVWRYRLRTEIFGISFLQSRDLEGETAVDIGANRGIYSYWMHHQVGQSGHVIAFEPQPELAIQLRDMRRTFRLNRLEIAHLGLSSKPGELALCRPKHHWGGASFAWEGPAFEQRKTAPDRFDVIAAKVTTIDDFFADHPARPIRFIKCDVEGFEHKVFQGGRKVLLSDRPEILFECHQGEDFNNPAFSVLRTLGYEGFCFYQDGFAPVRKFASLKSQLHRRALVDFVFVPNETIHRLHKIYHSEARAAA